MFSRHREGVEYARQVQVRESAMALAKLTVVCGRGQKVRPAEVGLSQLKSLLLGWMLGGDIMRKAE